MMVSKWLNKQFSIRGSDGPSLESLFGWQGAKLLGLLGVPVDWCSYRPAFPAEARTEVILIYNRGEVAW